MDSDDRLKICRQIDYYFSDFNLNNDKYLRTKLESSGSVSADHLLEDFNRIRELSKKIDKKDFLEIVSGYQFENAKFQPETESFGRDPAKPFEYDKNFLKKLSDRILHARKFPPKTLIMEIADWASSRWAFSGAKAIKRGDGVNKKFVRSALVCFRDEESLQNCLAQAKNQRMSYCMGEKSGEVVLDKYAEYLKYKNKQRQKKRKQKKLAESLANTAIQDPEKPTKEALSSSLSSKQKRGGFKRLVAKNTIYMRNVTDLKVDEKLLKKALKELDVIYLYTINHTDHHDYFLFFGKRSSMTKLHQEVHRDHRLKLSLFTNNNQDFDFNQPITEDNFNPIANLDQLPQQFNNYVNCLKHFFEKKY